MNLMLLDNLPINVE